MVDGASSLAKKMNVSELAIGLTIVAFGTSAPELIVNCISSIGNHDEVVFGNIIGSNIMNLILILGISAVISPIIIKSSTVWREIPYSLFALLLLFVLVNDELIFLPDEDLLTVKDGLIMLGFFIIFLILVWKNLRKDIIKEGEEHQILSKPKTIIFLVGGLVGLFFGGKMAVDNAVTLAYAVGWSEKLVGLTIIAIGTSLPELMTCIVASIKKRSDLAVGNIIGSNIFNILLILPVSAFFGRLEYDPVLNIDITILAASTILLFVFMFTSGKKMLDRWEGIVFLLGFVVYMIFLFMRN